jgi:hypothetical protein
LKLLRENDPLYPPEAQEVSAFTWMLLSTLRGEVEDKRNMGMFFPFGFDIILFFPDHL